MLDEEMSIRPRKTGEYFQRALKGLRLVFCLLLMSSCVLLPGCRFSDTLLEVIIDPATGVLEAHADPEYHEVEGAPLNPDLASVHLSENENFADQANFLPVYKEDAARGQAIRRSYEQQTTNSTDAVQGNERDDNDEQNTATSEETQTVEDPDASGEGDDAENTQTSDQGDGTQADKTAGRGGAGQTFGEGEYDELPEARAVAAKGQYALITQMLAGKGGLGATDAQFVADMQARGAFPNEGLEEIPVVWDGNGNLDVNALVASHADAILVDGMDVMLNDEQSADLTEAGINVVHVPTLGQTYTSDQDIVMAVKVVGQVLSGINSEATYSTADQVQQYIDLHDTAINGCLNENGGYSYKMAAGRAFQGIYQGTAPLGEDTTRLSQTRITTACIDSWTGTTGSSMIANREFGFHELPLNGQTIDLSDGVGLSARTVGKSCILSDYYLQVSGVVNNAYDNAKPVSTSAGAEESYPYAVMPGSSEGVTPQQVGVREIPSALWYSQTGISVEDRWITVGDQDFPGIIVRDGEIAQNVVRSASKVDGLYNVGQPYQVYQIPSGIAGNWLDGNVESFITAPWAWGVFQEGSIETPQAWIEAFYQQFYRIDTDAISHLEGFDVVTIAECPTGR